MYRWSLTSEYSQFLREKIINLTVQTNTYEKHCNHVLSVYLLIFELHLKIAFYNINETEKENTDENR